MDLVDIGRLELVEIETLKNWKIAKLNDVEGRAKISASSCVLIWCRSKIPVVEYDTWTQEAADVVSEMHSGPGGE